MEKVDTPEMGAVRVYEDQQSGDTYSQFEENYNKEEYWERVMDYFRSPEYRMLEDDPKKPELAEKIEKIWEESPLENWSERPQNREERKQKLELFWKVGEAIAEFYESIGYNRKQCPQCGYYSLEKVEECGGNSQKYEGCGYEFNYARKRGYNTQNKLEKGLGAINPEAESTTQEMVEKWGKEPFIEGMPSWSFLTKFKKFYWLFPKGDYSSRLSLSHHYVLASYYNARVIVLPEYWSVVDKAENDELPGVKEFREILSDAIDEYQKDPREKFLTSSKYRKYDET